MTIEKQTIEASPNHTNAFALPDDNVWTISDLIREQTRMCEEKVLKDVLERLLDRVPTLEDARQCKRVIPYLGTADRYLLVYQDMALGVVEKRMEAGQYTVRFTPATPNENGIYQI